MLKQGVIIHSSPFWQGTVEVEIIEEKGSYFRIIGRVKDTNTWTDYLIPKSELPRLSILRDDELFKEDPSGVFLALETLRYRFASEYDPLIAMNVSKVDPLPHQIDAVYGYILKLPRIRFLIADDPGAGKTIMAGLVIKELKLRGVINRVLIVCPGHLKDQWQRELREKFDEDFIIVDRNTMSSFRGTNIWERESRIITSLDFAKQDDVLNLLSNVYFDLAVVDEAHKMSAYRYGDKVRYTSRYRLGKVISSISNHLLFLTATPHKGDTDNFRLLLDLLEPGFFAANGMIEKSIERGDNPLFIRRMKENLVDFNGNPLFPPRHVQTITYKLGIDSEEEMTLYNELSKYVSEQYNLAISRGKERRNVAFALVILQRRLASSTYALLKSLERKRAKLSEFLSLICSGNSVSFSPTASSKVNENFDPDELDDLEESERWKQEEALEVMSFAENAEELKEEIRTLGKLIFLARKIIEQESELKLRELRRALRDLREHYQDSQNWKVLIFTESKDTMEYLASKIKEWGYSTVVIHGGMKMSERVEAEREFRERGEVLVATEAAGEGINLQFCNLMINYDIPWNPNRLEQRMGRIHRYGQQRKVYIYNLVAEDTREGRVLSAILRKLESMQGELGGGKVFDVIGEVTRLKRLPQVLTDATVNARDVDDILEEMVIGKDDEYINDIKKILQASLAVKHIDRTRIHEMIKLAEENRLVPEYTEDYFKKAFTKARGRIRERGDGFLSIDYIPPSIWEITQGEDFRRRFKETKRSYSKVTFDKKLASKAPDAEFISLGHPLFEAVMFWVEKHYLPMLVRGASFIDPSGQMDGYILFYEGSIQDGTEAIVGKRLFAVYIGKDNEVKPISTGIIWNLAEGDRSSDEVVDLGNLKDRALPVVISQVELYQEELAKLRQQQVEVKERYGIKSLEHVIDKLDGELLELSIRKEQNENVLLPIRNKKEMKAFYERSLVELRNKIEKEKNLVMITPIFMGIIRVRAPKVLNDEMHTSAEIERIGMEIAMEYERRQGREPEDVSSQNLGFDIRSKDSKGNMRYIEVKARASYGSIALTQNEWFMAQRFGDQYYIYAVMNASVKPELYIVSDPFYNLTPERRIEVVRYIVTASEVLNKGTKAN